MKIATEKDWETEYLSSTISVKSVRGVEDAINHIYKYVWGRLFGGNFQIPISFFQSQNLVKKEREKDKKPNITNFIKFNSVCHKSVVKNTDAIELSVGDTVWNESITIRESQFWIYISCPSETNCEEINLTVSDSIGTQFSTTGRFHLELVGNLSAGQASIVVTRDGNTSQELIINHIFFDLNSGEFIDLSLIHI